MRESGLGLDSVPVEHCVDEEEEKICVFVCICIFGCIFVCICICICIRILERVYLHLERVYPFWSSELG